jgi:hypothetical protein
MDKIRYVVSPLIKVARYWIDQKNLPRNVTIITPSSHYRGFDYNEENTLVLVGEEYDYPEFKISNRHSYVEMIDYVKLKMKLNKKEFKNE